VLGRLSCDNAVDEPAVLRGLDIVDGHNPVDAG